MLQRASRIRAAVCLRESVASAEIVFGPSPVDGGKVTVPIDVKLDLTFPEPAVRELGPCQERSNVATLASDSIQNRVRGRGPKRNCAPPLGVKIARVLGDVRFGISNLIRHQP